MASSEKESAVITVPADYIEDMRSALVAELYTDADMLQVNQADAARRGGGIEDADVVDADVEATVNHVRKDLRALEFLLSAEPGDREILTDRGTGFHALERMCRLLSDRLTEHLRYTPLDVLAVLAIAKRLEWATTQAMTIDPQAAVA